MTLQQPSTDLIFASALLERGSSLAGTFGGYSVRSYRGRPGCFRFFAFFRQGHIVESKAEMVSSYVSHPNYEAKWNRVSALTV